MPASIGNLHSPSNPLRKFSVDLAGQRQQCAVNPLGNPAFLAKQEKRQYRHNPVKGLVVGLQGFDALSGCQCVWIHPAPHLSRDESNSSLLQTGSSMNESSGSGSPYSGPVSGWTDSNSRSGKSMARSSL